MLCRVGVKKQISNEVARDAEQNRLLDAGIGNRCSPTPSDSIVPRKEDETDSEPSARAAASRAGPTNPPARPNLFERQMQHDRCRSFSRPGGLDTIIRCDPFPASGMVVQSAQPAQSCRPAAIPAGTTPTAGMTGHSRFAPVAPNVGCEWTNPPAMCRSVNGLDCHHVSGLNQSDGSRP